MDRGLIFSGMIVAQAAQGLAPVDTGRLSRSVTQGRPYSTGMGRRSINVGTNLVYGPIQELGGQAGRNRSAKIRPQPYLRPGLQMSKSKVIQLVGKSTVSGL